MIRALFFAAVLATGLGVPACGDIVQVREATVRERPSFLGRVVASVGYGEALGTAATQGLWIQVIRDGHRLGWVHNSALTRRTVEMRAGDEAVDSSVSSYELALSGKGFNADVEAQFRARHGDAGFRELDRMEKMEMPAHERAAFLREGGLTPKDGGRP